MNAPTYEVGNAEEADPDADGIKVPTWKIIEGFKG
jgi:hypothetical protein